MPETKKNPASARTLGGAKVSTPEKSQPNHTENGVRLQRPNPRGCVGIFHRGGLIIGHVAADRGHWLAIGCCGYIGAFRTALAASRAVLGAAS